MDREAELMYRPFLSVVTPVFDPPVEALLAAIDSVRMQSFGDWEMILVDDCSSNQLVRSALRESALADPRIRVIERSSNGGIVAASNDAIEAMTGEFVVLLDHDDLLSDDAFDTLVPVLSSSDDVDYVYSDEDKIDQTGRNYDTFEKPEWSPERLRHQMYTGHVSAIRASLVRELGGFREGFDGSQDHDLVLRVTEQARRIVHIPRVLYHWRVVAGSTAGDIDAKPYAWEAGRRAVQEHIDRVGIEGDVDLGPVGGTYRIRRKLDREARISVIIPTRGSRGLVWGESRCFLVEAIRSMMKWNTLPALEIVVVYDNETPPAELDQIRELARDTLTLVRFDGPFNFSAKCNAGFIASTGDYVIFLNDDVEFLEEDTLLRLVAPLREPDVGAVGARLLFEDGRLQHGGHVYSGGDWNHARFGAGQDDYGPFSALLIGREAVGLTAACLAIRRATYQEVGGLCESLPANFNDVDFSYKVLAADYRMLWFPEITLYHFESRTRVPTVHEWEVRFVQNRWGAPEIDPYFPQDSRIG